MCERYSKYIQPGEILVHVLSTKRCTKYLKLISLKVHFNVATSHKFVPEARLKKLFTCRSRKPKKSKTALITRTFTHFTQTHMNTNNLYSNDSGT